MFSGSVRYDGASQLAEGNKYDNFTAFSLGWNLMEEKFMKRLKDMVPEFKIRGELRYGRQCGSARLLFSFKVLSGHGR